MYVLLLRGINVGGKNKVSMKILRTQLLNLGYEEIITYINSGNILFSSSREPQKIKDDLNHMFEKNYDFTIKYSLIPAEEYKSAFEKLPIWWFEPMARKDVLFFTEEADRQAIISRVGNMKLHNEKIYIDENAIFWGKYDEKEYLKTAYHKYLLKETFYKHVTIRNERTCNQILSLIEK